MILASALAANVADKAQGKSIKGWTVNGTPTMGTTNPGPMLMGNPGKSPDALKVPDALACRLMTRVNVTDPPRFAVKLGIRFLLFLAVKPSVGFTSSDALADTPAPALKVRPPLVRDIGPLARGCACATSAKLLVPDKGSAPALHAFARANPTDLQLATDAMQKQG